MECALKACIAKRTLAHDFPPNPRVVNDYYSHKIPSLAKLAGLELEVTKWSEQGRYETHIESKDARDLYRAISNSRNGVLWLKKYW